MNPNSTFYKRIRSALLLSLLISHIPLTLFAQNLLDGPESVAFDSQNNRYLVSSFRNNRIIEIDTSGVQDTFKLGVYSCLGNHLEGDILFVSTGSRVKGIDINTHEYVADFPLSGASQLDGMTADTSGYLYVVESINRMIFKISLSDYSYTTLVNSGLGQYPQDVIFDKFNNRLLLCSWRANAPIEAINVNDGTITVAKETSIGFFDGITMDSEGNVYLSSHSGNNSVYKYDKDFIGGPYLISSGHNEPAGLDFNDRDNILAVPNYGGDYVDFIAITPTAIIEKNDLILEDFELFQNYPNPFNPGTTIQYYLEKRSFIIIEIFDVIGNKIDLLFSGQNEKGLHSVYWNGKRDNGQQANSGLYFYRISSEQFTKTKTMILLK